MNGFPIRGMEAIKPLERLGEAKGPVSGLAGTPGDGRSFADALQDALTNVDGQINAAEKSTERFMVGEGEDLHNVLLQTERADLSFRTMVEVRNKLLDAYREIMRMQV